MFSLFAEIERDLISQRTKEGIARARASGSKIGRPRGIGKHLLDNQREEIKNCIDKGLSISAISKLLEIPYGRLNHYVKSRKIK